MVKLDDLIEEAVVSKETSAKIMRNGFPEKRYEIGTLIFKNPKSEMHISVHAHKKFGEGYLLQFSTEMSLENVNLEVDKGPSDFRRSYNLKLNREVLSLFSVKESIIEKNALELSKQYGNHSEMHYSVNLIKKI